MSYDSSPKKKKRMPVGRQSGTCIPPRLKDGSPNPHFEEFLRGKSPKDYYHNSSILDQFLPKTDTGEPISGNYNSSKIYSEE